MIFIFSFFKCCIGVYWDLIICKYCNKNIFNTVYSYTGTHAITHNFQPFSVEWSVPPPAARRQCCYFHWTGTSQLTFLFKNWKLTKGKQAITLFDLRLCIYLTQPGIQNPTVSPFSWHSFDLTRKTFFFCSSSLLLCRRCTSRTEQTQEQLFVMNWWSLLGCEVKRLPRQTEHLRSIECSEKEMTSMNENTHRHIVNDSSAVVFYLFNYKHCTYCTVFAAVHFYKLILKCTCLLHCGWNSPSTGLSKFRACNLCLK